MKNVIAPFLPVVNSDKITPVKNKDAWSKGSGNQWIKCLQAAAATTTTTNNPKTKCKATS
jgi:hypothetical protein